MLSVVAENKGKEIPISWQELATKKIYTKMITPRVNPPKNQGSLGIQFEFSPVALMVISYDTPTQKLFSGITQTLNIMPWQLDAIGSLLAKSMKENNAKPVSEAVSGPVGIGFAVGSILQIPNAQVAILQLLNLAAIMSAALAFFNVLPIPALDGGRLFFILIEGITGRKVNQKVEGMIHTAGFVVLLGLILLITFQDLNRFVVPLFFK
jgi:regulator of sigma E protease